MSHSLRITSLRYLLAASLFVPACAADLDAEDEDYEDEPIVSSSDALSSSADCRVTKMTAYDKGRPYSIDVIKIGSKRTSKATGHAFLKMQAAATKAGVRLALNSGFRTNEEQKYFYNCYKTKKCNGGNLAAKPGYSNHQNGRALDLSTSTWLAKNAAKFGFKRTVPSEAWHYEFTGADPGGPCSGRTRQEPEQDDTDDASDSDSTSTGVGTACGSDGTCNPGNDGSGLVCEGGQCVDGCRTNAQCPGTTTCKSGKCR